MIDSKKNNLCGIKTKNKNDLFHIPTFNNLNMLNNDAFLIIFDNVLIISLSL